MYPNDPYQNIYIINRSEQQPYPTDPRFGWGSGPQSGWNPLNWGNNPQGGGVNPWQQGGQWNPFNWQQNQPGQPPSQPQQPTPPNQGGNQEMKPTSPPPQTVPSKTQAVKFNAQTSLSEPSSQGAALYSVSPSSMLPCKYKWTYIWMQGGRSFWLWIVYLDRRTVGGFTWNHWGPSYVGIDPNRIDMFSC